MRTWRLPVFILAALVALSACSDDKSSEGSSSKETSPTATKHSSKASATKSPSDDKSDDQSGSKPHKPGKSAHPDKHKPKKSKLALSVHGKKTTIRPTDVYCKGGRGHIRHIIGKTHNQPPLVKAKGKHFAMVKPGRSRPYKANKPSGVSYGKNHVTFHKTSLGPATLNGSMTCTKWEH